MRVVVTGASGFIGREAIAPLLAQGAEVHVLGRGGAAPEGTSAHAIDLLRDDPAALLAGIAPSHLLHFAWYAAPGTFWNAPENLDWVAASLRLVRAFAAAGGTRAVLAGSCAEYDWSHDRLDEATTPLAPATLYGEAKVSLFRLLDRAAPLLDVSFAWGRIFFPYGPFERAERVTGSALDAIVARRPAAFSAGTQQRDFQHVEDTAAAFVALLAGDVRGAVNIASGATISVRALVERAASLGDALPLMRFGARPIQPGEPPLLAASVARLHDEVGFRPRWNLDTGLRDALARRPHPFPAGYFNNAD